MCVTSRGDSLREEEGDDGANYDQRVENVPQITEVRTRMYDDSQINNLKERTLLH